MEIELKMTVAEINALLGVLGELPTKSGVYPLAVKIKEQTEAQLPQKEQK